MHKKTVRTLAIALAAASTFSAAQADISQGHWRVGANSTKMSIALYQDAADTDVTYLDLSVQTSVLDATTSLRTITGQSFTLDMAGAVYIVSPGGLLTNELLDGGAYPALAGYSGPQAWQSLTVYDNTDFWLGAKIRAGNAGERPWTGLGWAHLRFEDDGSITLLDSVMAYNETSLVVGAVPEPATWGLMLLGLAGLACVHRRQAAQRH